jgi:ABC-type nickel/cobalt efflux system permease component RcnA
MSRRLPSPDIARIVLAVTLAAAIGLTGTDLVLANPFGVGGDAAPSAPIVNGFSGWLLLKQAEFYRMMTSALRAARADGSASYGLVALSFAYGIFHAAGPGHGKAVISSYLLATEQTWRRGMMLSWLSAFLQATVAIAVVVICTTFLNLTAREIHGAVRIVEMASYLTIALLGLQLAWRNGRLFLLALAATIAVRPVVNSGGGQGVLGMGSFGGSDGNRGGCLCGRPHHVDPINAASGGSWKQMWTAIVGVGLRPCSGAIVVLVFAAAQEMLPIGILSTLAMAVGTSITVTAIATVAVKAKGIAFRVLSGGRGSSLHLLRGLEALAGIAVLAFGTLLLAGYMTYETALLR